ncbi:hypothetical protein ANME2D_01959 [Candidatus Methanoperedens nitroreducens]|uniref:Uncharacterized protein n=1 Tax=Candidatus Methanoperedens nitratireducens TaxID=1392998 RepID=A0A062V5Q1_9EURY|nr:hypothetical protein [Candidatus Methanoperedens nitroreducens]KCZ71903.1 hypothetical protein ANME2D_01959 [Candidatus Methanoperedens nitroreducens]MDJ1422124.1 hypothetical protein [Candidatus Methanoperedens sp.]
MFYIQEQKNVIEMLFPAGDYNLILESIGDFAEKEILSASAKNGSRREVREKKRRRIL